MIKRLPSLRCLVVKKTQRSILYLLGEMLVKIGIIGDIDGKVFPKEFKI